MADFVRVLAHTIPAGNGVFTTTTFQDALGLCWVEQIELNFPPGCAGLVKARIGMGGSPVYPNQSSDFFVYDDYVVRIPVTNQGSSGQWRLEAQNADYITHKLSIAYYCNYVIFAPGQPTSAPVSI